MHPNQVVWQPYEAELGHLPAYCFTGREVWTARVLLWYDRVTWRFFDHPSAALPIMIASHKQLLMCCIVGSPDYKQITDVLKAVDRLHRIIAYLPMQNTNEANLEAPEDTGRPSTSLTPASHSYGQCAATDQASHISSATPLSPAVVGSLVVGSEAKQLDVHAENKQTELIDPAMKGTNHGICTLSWHQHKHIIAFISGPTSQVMVCDYEDSVIFGELANLVAYMFAPAVLVTPLGA
ncbi:hypothetical protein SO802_018543 [Lithocarpus litseifolius]|uniref:Uncharacterized protein n=1 Tax=Lithocarpus litseifolius TaxID=425828 RepID=A0AAW2CQV1_9ROSI